MKVRHDTGSMMVPDLPPNIGVEDKKDDSRMLVVLRPTPPPDLGFGPSGWRQIGVRNEIELRVVWCVGFVFIFTY